MEDMEIIALYWKRDEQAIRETERKYGRFCQTLAMNILLVCEDAEECVSDAYHKAWTAIPPERPRAFRAWLGKIVRNLSINRWRYNRAQKRGLGAEELLSELAECIPERQTTEELVEARALSQYLDDWLLTLSDPDRALFVRRYWSGEPLQTLADLSGIPPGKLASRMFRLRKGLQQYLREREVAL